MSKHAGWAALALLALAACSPGPSLIGGDLAYELSVPPEQRQACAALTDDEAVARARAWFMAKSEDRRNSPVWQGKDPTKLDVLSVERTNVIVIRFGANGESRVVALVYEDCLVGWSE